MTCEPAAVDGRSARRLSPAAWPDRAGSALQCPAESGVGRAGWDWRARPRRLDVLPWGYSGLSPTSSCCCRPPSPRDLRPSSSPESESTAA